MYHDNTFGTPEEDAFRRDFTVNALFYDIATRSIIDYVGGLQDVRDRLIRCIGNPDERFGGTRFACCERWHSPHGWTFRSIRRYRSIGRNHGELAPKRPPRLLEELYKVLRAGSAERTFRALLDTELLAAVAPEAPGGSRRRSGVRWPPSTPIVKRHKTTPETLTNAVLLGTLLIP